MDIFSLISPEEIEKKKNQPHKEHGGNDGFETPRSTAEWSSSSALSTPRSLFSTPPTSPRRAPKTPPRPTSNVDDRIRMRRYKMSMSPSRSPVKYSKHGGGGDWLSETSDDTPLSRRDPNISFSSAGDDDADEEDSDYMSTPDNTPNSSPRKGDLLSLSPIQQRLARARTKRQQILEERVQHIDTKSKEKEQLALKRKEDATLEKVSKARTEESIILAKSKREQILEERVQQIDVKSKTKGEEATKRKDEVTLEKVEKARTELAKSPIAKERRDQQVALRVQTVEATLETKTALAQRRHEHNLFEKQQRASCKERKELAERRRKLISYEKRARLLAALDAKLERAALKSHKFNEEKATRAGEDIVKAKEVSRRVKAARTIQGLVREAYGLSIPECGYALDLSQHDAAERLQLWFRWRAQVCSTRLSAVEGGAAAADDDQTSKAMEALGRLLELFPPAEQRPRRLSVPKQHIPFESISHIMMQPETLKIATLIVDCLRPINEVSFGDSDSNLAGSTAKQLDGRTLLSLCLIAVHPREVLGDGFDKTVSDDGELDRAGKVSRLLASTSKRMLQAISELRADSIDRDSLKRISTSSTRAKELFMLWKTLDMEQLLSDLTKQLEQSWVVYLTSSDTLKYLADVTGVDSNESKESKKDDPVMSLRLRHEAGRTGSRSHIKRIRVSLNKLVGVEEGKEVVKSAKLVALKTIEESGATEELKGEIDEIHSTASTSKSSDVADDSEQMAALSVDLPDELLSNRMLVHRILLTDPNDFNTLSWDGSNAQAPCMPPEELMASFLPEQSTGESSSNTSNLEDVTTRLAQSLKMAFFNQIAQEMAQGNYDSVRELLKELHVKMRSLLPSRKDLHSHINDEEVSLSSTGREIIRVLIRSGYLLANYLESAARAPTTTEMIEFLETFNSHAPDGGDNVMIPYGLESEELFVVASIAYILYKAELCQADVSNYKLSQAAPLLHTVGSEYERKHFINTHGDYRSSSIEELQNMLPSTWNWVKKVQSLFGSSENVTSASSYDQKMDFLKGKGFVDGILFTRSQLALPEFLSLDVESINHIRSEAKIAVIASALALHACNISKVGSVLSSTVMSDEVNEARNMLSCNLRKKHYDQNELESEVVGAVGTLTRALAERDLTEDERGALKNHITAVLHGNDPVLKLLDNRVQSFFRFACKWKPDTASSSAGSTAPVEMKTGRTILKGSGDDVIARHGLKSTKEEFTIAAMKEALRLGFAYVGTSDLIKSSHEARGIIGLACTNYGHDVLDRFLGAASEKAS